LNQRFQRLRIDFTQIVRPWRTIFEQGQVLTSGLPTNWKPRSSAWAVEYTEPDCSETLLVGLLESSLKVAQKGERSDA